MSSELVLQIMQYDFAACISPALFIFIWKKISLNNLGKLSSKVICDQDSHHQLSYIFLIIFLKAKFAKL